MYFNSPITSSLKSKYSPRHPFSGTFNICSSLNVKLLTRFYTREKNIINTAPVQDTLFILGKATRKFVPLHATKALEGRGGLAPTHSRPWY
jgi:hypothetical protein